MSTRNDRTEQVGDRDWLRDMRKLVSHVETGASSALERLVVEQCSYTQSAIGGTFQVAPGEVGWTLAVGHAHSKYRADARGDFETYLRTAPADFTTFPWLRPGHRERNRTLMNSELPSWDTVAKTDLGRRFFHRHGFRRLFTLRVLICDGPMLLAWSGIYREEPFLERDRALMKALMPAVRNRLRLERTLGPRGSIRNLVVALEGILPPAFIIDRRARIAFANSAGAALFSARRAELLAGLRASLTGAPPSNLSFSVSPLVGPGEPESYLAIASTGTNSLFAAALGAASARWLLTQRQADVLALLAGGDSNKDIAEKLGCALGTVELHVSAVLNKARAESRSQLIARFYTGK
jgi:DNA-binding CsgD family transcriptional regulator/PAS domain-containing protein